MKILQGNLRHSSSKFDLLLHRMYLEHIEFFLVQDPPVRVKLSSYSIPGFRFIRPAVPPEDMEVIVVCAQEWAHSGVRSLPSDSGRVAGLHFTVGTCTLTLCSVYIQHSHGVGFSDMLRLVRQWQAVFPRGHFVFGGDFNARSAFWGPPVTQDNYNASLVLDFLAAGQFSLCNTWDDTTPATFTHARGQEGWLDLTICSSGLLSSVVGWHVEAREDNLSDHALVFFEIVTGLPVVSAPTFCCPGSLSGLC